MFADGQEEAPRWVVVLAIAAGALLFISAAVPTFKPYGIATQPSRLLHDPGLLLVIPTHLFGALAAAVGLLFLLDRDLSRLGQALMILVALLVVPIAGLFAHGTLVESFERDYPIWSRLVCVCIALGWWASMGGWVSLLSGKTSVYWRTFRAIWVGGVSSTALFGVATMDWVSPHADFHVGLPLALLASLASIYAGFRLERAEPRE